MKWDIIQYLKKIIITILQKYLIVITVTQNII